MRPESPDVQAVALHVVGVLDDLEIRYHLGGSYASSTHGIPRQTQDIDLVVALAETDVTGLIDGLGESFYADADSLRRAVQALSSANVVHLPTGIKVDLFVAADEPFDREELSRSQRVRLASGHEVWVKSPEDTVLRKLLWYRAGGEASDRQWSDAAGVVAAQGGLLDRDYLSRWSEVVGVDDLLRRLLE